MASVSRRIARSEPIGQMRRPRRDFPLLKDGTVPAYEAYLDEWRKARNKAKHARMATR